MNHGSNRKSPSNKMLLMKKTSSSQEAIRYQSQKKVEAAMAKKSTAERIKTLQELKKHQNVSNLKRFRSFFEKGSHNVKQEL